jgi:hypothetical protein
MITALIYFTFGVLIAFVYKFRFNIKKIDSSIAAHIGNVLGFTIIAIIWPIALNRIIRSY